MFDPFQLRKWRSGRNGVVLNDGYAAVHLVGASDMAGSFNNGAGDEGLFARSIAYHLAKILQREGVNTETESSFGDRNYLGSSLSLSTYDPRLSIGAGWGAASEKTIGGKMLANSTTTNALSFTPVSACNRAIVFYLKSPAMGQFTVDFDGASPSTVNAYIASGFEVGVAIYSGSLGQHTINIKPVTGNAVKVIGIVSQFTSQKTVAIYNHSAISWGLADFLDDAEDYSPLNMLALLGTYSPSLYVLMFGTKEMISAVSVVDYTTRYQDLITACKASGDVLLIFPPQIDTGLMSAPDQDEYVQAALDLADTKGCPILNVRDMWGAHAESRTLNFMQDDLHPTGVGCVDIASALAGALLR